MAFHRTRHHLVAAAVLALAGSAWAQTPSFDIPAQPLDAALAQLARQAGLQLLAPPALVQGRPAGAVRGSMAAQDAARRLLQGSGLSAHIEGTTLVVESAAPSATLGEVTVTAQAARADGLPDAYAGGQVARGARLGLLGNQDFMDTPFSTAAYTEDFINDTQATDIGAVIAATDASVYVAQKRGLQESFLMRGFSISGSDITFNGLAGMAPMQRGSTEMAERVEIQKGPSAMLGGMTPGGSVGGSVNIVPKRAGDEPLTRLTTTYESDSQFGLHADIGRRFGERKQFGIRFNGVVRDGDTAVDNQQHKMALGSLGLDWRGERVRVSADIYRQRERMDGIDYFGISTIAAGVTQLPAPFDGRTNLAAPWFFNINTANTALARAEWDITDNVTAYAAYGRRDSSYDALISRSTLLNDAGDISAALVRQYYHQVVHSGEAGVRGKFSTGAVDHAWSLAFTGYQSEYGVVNKQFAASTNIYALNYGAEPNLAGFSTSGVPMTSRTELDSVALADRMSFLGDTVQLTLGARHQKVKTTSINATTGAGTVGYDESALSPSAALLVKLTPRLSVYGSYIQGLSQGSAAPATAANAYETLAPFKTKQYEVGAKYDFGRLAATASLYQITKPSAYTDPATNLYAASGEQRNRGVDVSVFGEVQRGLRVLGGVSYIDATLRKQLKGLNDGKQATGVPHFIARLGAEYDVPAVQGLTLTGRVNHVGQRYATADNRLSLSSYATLDVGARYATRMGGRPVVLRASIDNLTNKAYWGGSWQGSGDSGLSGGLGAPRTVQLSATVDF
ncbi:MAG: TonB-dependent receptor [Acidovorax sp.]